jgi:dethiobiotin synthetase
VKLFLTGTDTGVGKTHVASMLVRALRKSGVDAIGFKPICCGDRDDAEMLHAAADGAISLNDVNPIWLRAPAAPLAASMIENRIVDLALIREAFRRVTDQHAGVVVEGVGGWLVPITRDYSTADLAVEFGLPVVIVVANRLGALNHTLLTIESIRSRQLECAGIILNQVQPPSPESIAETTNRGILEEVAGVPVLGEIAYGEAGDVSFLSALIAGK